ncbi:hypothetical protein MNBD_IGNAVI01-1354 [hydrothermal vent metagenome]|uniref:Uncharacterized protein n=1 Tax=hydrothermal vent metagenome TaxID=652676 RepID=A0A3B1CKY0_9ZZZZ
MQKFLIIALLLFPINLFSQSETNEIFTDSTNIESFLEEFCKIGIKDEFEKIKDYQARIKSINEQKLGSNTYLIFVKEIDYDPNEFTYDAELERYFMAQFAADLSVRNQFKNFLQPNNIVVKLFSKEVLMTLTQKKLGLFGSFKDYFIASNVDYEEYTNINGDELSSRIFIYMPIDEAKAFKKKKNRIGMKIKMKLENYADSKMIKASEFFPDTKDKITDHTYYVIRGDIDEIMFYNLSTNKIYTTYRHQAKD